MADRTAHQRLLDLLQKLCRANSSHCNTTAYWPYSDSATDECYPMTDVLDVFHLYYIPAIILVGLVGNLLSCAVFLNTHLKLRSSSYYLAALATADFGFLATLLLVWLNSFGVQVYNRNGWCQSLVYLSSVCSFLSVWLIVAFTVERFIAVQYPLHRPRMCTVTRAKAIVAGLVGIALPAHIYSFWTAGLLLHEDGSPYCDLLPPYHDTMRAINIVDSLATLILPVVLIIVMNTMITRNLLRFGRRFKRETEDVVFPAAAEPNGCSRQRSDPDNHHTARSSSNNPSAAGSSGNNNGSSGSRRQASFQQFKTSFRQPTNVDTCSRPSSRCIHVGSSSRNLVSTKTQHSITKMLLLISTVFILLNLPSYVIRLYVFLRFSLWHQQAPPKLWCMQQFFMFLYYTNFSINFLLYSMCGITFRRCLWQLIRNNLKSLTRYHCDPQQYT